MDKMPTSYDISAHGLTVRFLDYGACLVDIRVDGHPNPLIIGYQNSADYLSDTEHMGAIAGPIANRISNAQTLLDGALLSLEANEAALGNHLHSGSKGLGKRFWEITAIDGASATLSCQVADGETGLPGNRVFEVCYCISGPGQLDVQMQATTDKPSFCNMLTHPYFNLDGRPDIGSHHLEIAAASRLDMSDKNTPTGQIISVDGTRFDFQKPRNLAPFIDGTYPPLDHNFCISQHKRSSLSKLARLYSEHNGIELEVWSDQPGLQCYLGQGLGNTAASRSGQAICAFAGICLEPQFWPDAPNQPHFPSIRFDADTPYSQHSRFVFISR